MVDVELNYNKINGYLNSFLAEKTVQNINLSDCTNSKENTSFTNADFLSPKQLFTSQTTRKHIENSSHEKAKTVPTNCQHFRERLITFEFGLWTCTRISPVICASYGWKLSEKDMLNCVTCNAVICSLLPLPNQVEAYTNFTNILKNRLQTGHKEWCGWPNNSSPSEFLHPPLNASVHYLRKLLDDANELCSLNESLPYFNVKEILKKLELDEKQIARFYGRHTKLDKIRLTGALLVLCGWVFESGEKLKCGLCLRNIGLWNFVALSKEEEYLKLKERNEEKEAMRIRNGNRKKERERRALIKEEQERIRLETEKKALEEQRKAEEEALKVKLAIEKITQIENEDDTRNEFEGSDENDEVDEEEENILLSEDNVEVEEEEPGLEEDKQDDVAPEEGGETEMQLKDDKFKNDSRISIKSNKDSSRDMSDTFSDTDSLSGENVSQKSDENSLESSPRDENEERSPVAGQDSIGDEEHNNQSDEDEEHNNQSDEDEEHNNQSDEDEEHNKQSDEDEEHNNQSDEDEEHNNQSFNAEEGEIERHHQESLNEDYEEGEYVEDEEVNKSEEELWLEAVGGVAQDDDHTSSTTISEGNSQDRPKSLNALNKANQKRRRSWDSSEGDSQDGPRSSGPLNANRKRRRSSDSSEGESKYKPESSDALNNAAQKRRRSWDSSDGDSQDGPRSSGPLNANRERRRSSDSSEGESKYKPESSDALNNADQKRRRSWDSSDGDSQDGPRSSGPLNANRKRRSSSDSSEGESKDKPESSDALNNANRKRRRSTDSSDADTDELETASKYPRLDEELQELLEERMAAIAEESNNENREVGEEVESEKEVSEDEEEEEPTEEDSIYDTMKKSLFEPLEQHRHWCGWVVDHSSLYVEEETTSPVPGFKILPPQLWSLLPEVTDANLALSEKYAKNVDGCRTVRNLLDSWSVPENEDEQKPEDEDMEVN